MARPLKNFIYIAAYVTAESPKEVTEAFDESRGRVAKQVHDFLLSPAGLISFRHVVLKAVDSDDAYTRGFKLLNEAHPLPPGIFINDYVVPSVEEGPGVTH